MPSRPDLAQYVKRTEDLVNSAQSENTSALKEFCNDWLEKFVRISGPDLTDFVRGSYERAIGEVEKGAREMKEKAGKGGREFGLVDAQFLVARAHSFESWNAFAVHVDLASRETPDGAEFEVAADAVVDGDLPKLESLLIRNPALAHARSGREHRATLLYYLAANGVEDFRQRSPANAPEIARLLLDSGAEVETVAMDAGLSMLDLTREFVEGRAVSQAELGAAFELACRFGRTDTAEYLLAQGADVDGRGAWNMTGLMWAAGQGHLDTTAMILDHGPSLELRNEFGGTAMGTALHFAINAPNPGADYPAVIDALLKAGLKFEGSRKGTGVANLDDVLRKHGLID